jgi:ADP-heptose:LPS heptosyltransferase
MSRPRLFDLVDGLVALRGRWRKRPGDGILLVSSGGLGDTILFSLAVGRFIELARDGEAVDVVVRSDTAVAAFLFPERVNVISVDYRRFLRQPFYRLRTCLKLQDGGYRVAVSTDHLRLPTVDDALVMACAAEEAYALEPRTWPKHDSRLHRNRRRYDRWIVPSAGMAHRMVRWIELINGLTGRDDPPPLVRFDDNNLPPPAGLARPTVVLHPFSAIRERQHGPALFDEIIAALPKDVDVVVSAGPGDLERNPDFRVLLEGARVSVDEDGLEAKAALLRAARLVVSVDTSILHLAVGVGAPTVCLASAAHVVDSIPYDSRMIPDNVTFFYHDMPCRGCLGSCTLALEDGRYPCIARLDRDQVLEKVRELSGESP